MINFSCSEEKEILKDGFLHEIKSQDYDICAYGNGLIEPLSEKNITTPAINVGQLTIEYMPDEGSFVSTGEIIVKFDTKRIKQNNRWSFMELDWKKVEFAKQSIENRLDYYLSDSNVIKKSIYKNSSKKILEYLESGHDPDEIKKSELNIKSSAIDVENLTQQYENRKQIIKEGFISHLELKKLKHRQKRSILTEKKASNYLSILKEQADEQDIQRYKTEVDKYSIDEKLAIDDRDSKKKINELNIQKKKLEIDSKETITKQKEHELEQCIIKSPTSGIVIYGRTWSGKMRVGTSVWRGLPILKIVNVDRLKLVARIDERDIDMVKLDSKANIYPSAFPDKVFTGVVKHIDKIAQLKEKGDNKGAKYFRVTIEIDGNKLPLKPMETAKTSILKTSYKNSIVIPKDFVKQNDDKYYVSLNKNGKILKTEIQISDKDNDRYIIKSGLKNGDKLEFLYK